MTDLYTESYPAWIMAGEIAGSDWSAFPDLATLKGSPSVGDALGPFYPPGEVNRGYPFGPASYVTLGDGSKARWDGSSWSLFTGPVTTSSPAPPAPPPLPTSSSTKAEIIEWLHAHHVDQASDSMTKADLLALVTEHEEHAHGGHDHPAEGDTSGDPADASDGDDG